MKLHKTYFNAIGAALVLPFCWVSCVSDHDTTAVSVNPEGWVEPAVLVYDNTDTLSLKEAAIVLRYGAEAKPLTGRYVVEASSPAGGTVRDTLDIIITPDGTGNSFGETHTPFRTNVRLVQEGEYIFRIIPLQESHDIWNVAVDFRKLQ